MNKGKKIKFIIMKATPIDQMRLKAIAEANEITMSQWMRDKIRVEYEHLVKNNLVDKTNQDELN